MIRVTRTILMLRQKVLFNCGDSAKGRAEDCGEPASAGARYPGGCQGLPQSLTPLIICCSGLGSTAYSVETVYERRTSIYSWRLPRSAGDALLASLATPGRFTGDHPVDHAQLARLTPERGLFSTGISLRLIPVSSISRRGR
jgi:hypothetical protein